MEVCLFDRWIGVYCSGLYCSIRVLLSFKGYYEIVSFVVIAPDVVVPEPTFAGLAASAAFRIRPAVPETALRSRWGELTGPRELNYAFPGLAAGEAGHSPCGARRAVLNSRFEAVPRGAAAYNGNSVRTPCAVSSRGRDPQPR